MPSNYRTPGVYVKELDAFPKSIVGVQTAVPAFIGYTQQATINGQSLLNKPVAITSMAEFEQTFGTEFVSLYDITAAPVGINPDLTIDSVGYIVAIKKDQPQFNLYYSMRLFYENGGSNCYVVSVGLFSTATQGVQLADLQVGLKAISYQVGPTMLVVPDAVLLPASGDSKTDYPGSDVATSSAYNTFVQDAMRQCVALQDRVAIYDIYDTLAVTQDTVDTNLDACIGEFQQAVIGANVVDPSYGIAYFPFLNTSIVQSSDINYVNFNSTQAVSITATPVGKTQLQAALTLFNQAQFPDPSATVKNPTQQLVQKTIDALVFTDSHDSATVATNNNLLVSALPQYKQLLNTVADKAGVLPPSGAMAGIFTQNDQTRGVWNAPANLSVGSTLSLTVDLNNDQQGGLNVPINGYAIDVIRNFVGRGQIVWGGRTLNGNSQDWRYIQVRRTIIYIEQSLKQAINQFVFAPNVASTWVSVVQMISGFLQNLWSQGGLMGAKASDAFTVLCGVPDTMTGTDVLNGYMVVQVTLQMVHPAEFIELTFKQTMQGA